MKLAIFAVLIVVVISCLLLLPTIHIDVDAVTASTAFEYIRAGLYFFPVQTVLRIISLTLSLWVFRIIIAVVKTIWDLLPVA